MISRFIQGYYVGISITISYAETFSYWTDPKVLNKKLTILSMSFLLGSCLGPLCATFFLSFTNHIGTYSLYSMLMVIILILFSFFFKNIDNEENLNEILSQDYDTVILNEKQTLQEKYEIIEYKVVFKNPIIAITLTFLTILGICYIYFSPGLSNYLIENYEINLRSVNFYLSLIYCINFFSGILFMKMNFKKTFYSIFSISFFLFFGYLFLAPFTKYFPKNIYISLFGFFLINFAFTILTNIFNEVILDAFDKNLPNIKGKSKRDFIAGLFSITISLLDFLGPTIAGIQMKYVSFQNSCLFLAFFIFSFSLIIFVTYYFASKFIEKKTLKIVH